MGERARRPLLSRRPEAWYLLAAVLAGGSAVASVLNQPTPFALAVLGAAALCLVLGLALHSAPSRQADEDRPQRSVDTVGASSGGDSEPGARVS